MPVRILIADDSPLVLSSVKSLLESHTNDWKICAEATDGVQTLGKALQARPDLIILDFQMPLMDGLRAFARIVKALPHVPILIYTIHKSPFLDAEAKKAGVRQVIAKPDTAALVRAVSELLRKFPDPLVSRETKNPA